MRSAQEIFDLIDKVAREDPGIRAVLLNGSRANTKIRNDKYQDYDLVFLVADIEGYVNNPEWVNVFGERIIMQIPGQVDIGEDDVNSDDRITYLMLFKDLNRIDLTLLEVSKKDSHSDSLTRVLLDKDGLFPERIMPSDRDYWVKKPTQKQFHDHCNEFWWVSTYVIKGLLRKELIYAKEMLEIPVRNMFMQLLEWYVGVENQFSVNLGANRKFLKEYISEDLWASVQRTYPNLEAKNMWNSLKEMMAVFEELEKEVARRLDYDYRQEEITNVTEYLKLREPEFFGQFKQNNRNNTT